MKDSIRTGSHWFTRLGLLVGITWVGVIAVYGQSALDGFNPNANGEVTVVVLQPDGKILIGGNFTTVAPNGGPRVTRNHVARLNPDGTLDSAFDPNANYSVYAIALQANGKILVGGAFSSIGGQIRPYVARLDPATGLADSFSPNLSGGGLGDPWPYAIAVQADGKILVGGDFTTNQRSDSEPHCSLRSQNWLARFVRSQCGW